MRWEENVEFADAKVAVNASMVDYAAPHEIVFVSIRYRHGVVFVSLLEALSRVL